MARVVRARGDGMKWFRRGWLPLLTRARSGCILTWGRWNASIYRGGWRCLPVIIAWRAPAP
jgi:hypothetical protein